ncbi:MAG: hypothetical protein R3B48_18495 [Kofleriaceae bacterium]
MTPGIGKTSQPLARVADIRGMQEEATVLQHFMRWKKAPTRVDLAFWLHSLEAVCGTVAAQEVPWYVLEEMFHPGMSLKASA